MIVCLAGICLLQRWLLGIKSQRQSIVCDDVTERLGRNAQVKVR